MCHSRALPQTCSRSRFSKFQRRQTLWHICWSCLDWIWKMKFSNSIFFFEKFVCAPLALPLKLASVRNWWNIMYASFEFEGEREGGTQLYNATMIQKVAHTNLLFRCQCLWPHTVRLRTKSIKFLNWKLHLNLVHVHTLSLCKLSTTLHATLFNSYTLLSNTTQCSPMLVL